MSGYSEMLSSLMRLGRELMYISERMTMSLWYGVELLSLSPGQRLMGIVSCVDIPERPFRVFRVYSCVDIDVLFANNPITLYNAVVTKLCVECKGDKCYLGYYYRTPGGLKGYAPIVFDTITTSHIFNLSCTVSPEDVGKLAAEVSKIDAELGKKLTTLRMYMDVSRTAEVSNP